MRFTTSVWVKDGELGVTPITTVEEAAAIIGAYPNNADHPFAYVAGKSIESAKAGHIKPDQAKPHFLDFCEKAGLLAEDRIAL
ncbi:hypothetical protein ACX3P1_12225 [Mesorhizobium sp. A623]